MSTFGIHRNRLAAICPLRGGLGETRFTQLRPTGELVAESALLVPDLATPVHGLLARYFQVFGMWPSDAGRLTDAVLGQLVGQVRGGLRASEVLTDDAVLMSRRRMALPGSLTVLDSGAIVVRPGAGARLCVVPRWVRPVASPEDS